MNGLVLPGGSSMRLFAYFKVNLHKYVLDGRTWEGLCCMLHVTRLHLSGGVVLPGSLVICGCKMVCPNQLYRQANVGGGVRGSQGRGCT